MIWCQCNLLLSLDNKMDRKILGKNLVRLWGKYTSVIYILIRKCFGKVITWQSNNKDKLNYSVITNNLQTSVLETIRFLLILHIHCGSTWSSVPCCSHWGIQVEGTHVDKKGNIWNIASGHNRKIEWWGELSEASNQRWHMLCLTHMSLAKASH